MKFHHFDMRKRIKVDLSRLDFQVLPELFKAGDEYLEALEKSKAELRAVSSTKGGAVARKRLKGELGLRERDPWV